MKKNKSPEVESTQSPSQLQAEIAELRRDVLQLQMENQDLENSLLTAIEHGDLIETELLELNKSLKSEVIERKMAQATLQSILEIVYRDKSDLEIMLATATEHGDTIEYEQYNRAVETMRQSEEQFRAIAESTSIAMLVSDIDTGLISYANTSAGAMLQKDACDLLNTSVTDLYYLETEWLELKDYFVTNQKVRDYEIRLNRGEQPPIWVLASLHLLWLKGKQVLLNTFYDVTLLKNTEIALRESESRLREQANLLEQRVEQRTHALKKAKESAEAASRSKAAFLANMSHELRTPLNAILGFAQLMLYDQELNAQHQADLQAICNSGNHLLTMINDILEMSKLEAGSVLLRLKECYLYDITATVREMLSLKAIEKNLELDVSIQPDVPQRIYTDEGKLRQVLINLMGNAIKFTNDGYVRLRISVEPDPHQSLDNALENVNTLLANSNSLCLHCAVEDTGVGIEESEIAKLFQPFVQTASGMRSQEGTGLGLSISYNYIKLMGGQMSVESRVNQGSVFQFYIPIQSLDDCVDYTIKPHSRIVGIEGKQKYRILVAEDMRFNRQLLARIIAPLGFELREVGNGEEVIALWRSWSPHLIWMDIRMPILDGYAATSEIRKIESSLNMSNSQKVKIIALTANLVDIQQEDLLLYGFDGLITKPFTEEQIFTQMSKLLNLKYIYDSTPFPS
ncbi:response regulator [Pseudanabaena sp. FACHB-1277]|uniref:Circadian input-output histidine kinase CikA n=1 Tax=Pseudanabaena cinerea FACHB-1277 TaxID=2949581 RepID=A0A926UQM5_9CYAN|nr:ATP-binding protein [Pseudanabaena cinerea]MBD2149237.1 response regulator [Pseudanabaena cinerea FACHB-1277]